MLYIISLFISNWDIVLMWIVLCYFEFIVRRDMFIKCGEGKGLECGYIGLGCGCECRIVCVKKVLCWLGIVVVLCIYVCYLFNVCIVLWSNCVCEIWIKFWVIIFFVSVYWWLELWMRWEVLFVCVKFCEKFLLYFLYWVISE